MNISEQQRLAEEFAAHIPMTQAMGVKVEQADAALVRLIAPLAPNINDKGTGFGGSINSVMTLAGWGLVWLALKREQLHADLVIHTQEVTFLQPLKDAIDVRARYIAEDTLAQIQERYQRGRRARADLSIEAVDAHGEPVAVMQARYVVLPK
jgi:thioesterase domain-containing protein